MYISIIVSISRPECIPVVFSQLEKILADHSHEYELIICVDNRKISNLIIRRLLEQIDFRLRNFELFNTRRNAPSKISVPTRRNRIADNMNQISARLGGSQFVFGFEDDTIIPTLALPNLLETYGNCETEVGFVEGVQMGRWGVPYLGAWTVDNIDMPQRYTTIFNDPEIKEIHAGGFYCFLTPTNLFKSVEHKWNDPVGPDVNYGLELCRKGLTNLIDWRVICPHITKAGVLKPDDSVVSVEFYQQGDRWVNKTHHNINKTLGNNA